MASSRQPLSRQSLSHESSPSSAGGRPMVASQSPPPPQAPKRAREEEAGIQKWDSKRPRLALQHQCEDCGYVEDCGYIDDFRFPTEKRQVRKNRKSRSTPHQHRYTIRVEPESCRRFFREFRPLSEPPFNPLLNKPEPLEDKSSDHGGTRNIRGWARSVSAGTPASASSAPSSEAGLSAIDATTNRTKSSHEAHLYNSALNKNHMEFVTELRPDLEAVVAKLTKPLKVGEPLASDEDIVRKLDYLEMQLDILMDNISMIRKQHIDETPYEKTLDIAIPTNSFGISLALRCIRALKPHSDTKPPEMDYLSSAINLAIRTEHYHNFFDWEVISTAKPGSIVGMPLSWLRNFVEEVICDDDIAYIIIEKVWDSVRLCPAASLVFAPVIVEDNKDRQLQPINEAADQLRGAVAAALEANSPYLKDSNVVFGVAANLSVMFLYVAWREEAKSAGRKPHYCFYRLRGFNLEEKADMRQAQHLLIRIYVWAARERRVAIEEELRPLLLKEKEEVLKRRDGTKEPGELDRGSQ